MIVTFDKIHDTISIEFTEDGIIETYKSSSIPSMKLHNLMNNTSSVLLAKIIGKDGRITESIVVPEYNSQCHACMFNGAKMCGELKCDGVIFMKPPGNFIRKSSIENLVCNEDICPYIENCNSAPLCLLKILIK